MKALLIKDLLVLKAQKKSLILILFLGILFSVMNEGFFGMGYIGIIFGLLSISTLSYDEYEHGNTFLFTLPFKRSTYVAEKYLIAFMGTMIGVGIGLIVTLVKNRFLPGVFAYSDLFVTFIGVLAAAMIMVSVMIPLRLKFDNETGRTITGIVLGLMIAGAIILLGMISETKKLLLLEKINNLSLFSGTLLVLGLTLIIVLISIGITTRIVNNKEF